MGALPFFFNLGAMVSYRAVRSPYTSLRQHSLIDTHPLHPQLQSTSRLKHNTHLSQHICSTTIKNRTNSAIFHLYMRALSQFLVLLSWQCNNINACFVDWGHKLIYRYWLGSKGCARHTVRGICMYWLVGVCMCISTLCSSRERINNKSTSSHVQVRGTQCENVYVHVCVGCSFVYI